MSVEPAVNAVDAVLEKVAKVGSVEYSQRYEPAQRLGLTNPRSLTTRRPTSCAEFVVASGAAGRRRRPQPYALSLPAAPRSSAFPSSCACS